MIKPEISDKLQIVNGLWCEFVNVSLKCTIS